MFIKNTKYSNPTYICDKCGKRVEYRPKRLGLFNYTNSIRGYDKICNYDLCDRCYTIFNRWIYNLKKEE